VEAERDRAHLGQAFEQVRARVLTAAAIGLEPELTERVVPPTPKLAVEIDRARMAAARRDLSDDRDLAERLRLVVGARRKAHGLTDLAPLPDAAVTIERVG